MHFVEAKSDKNIKIYVLDGERKKGCFKCGSEEHRAAECEQPDVCRRCGEEGHMSKECENEMKTRTVTNAEGEVKEYYVPTEQAEENLFSSGISQGINFEKYEKIQVSF